MYNLLMKCDPDQIWWENNNVHEEERLFEYTNKEVREKYINNTDELKNFPCLFTYERYGQNNKIKGYIGHIKSIEKKNTYENQSKIIIEYFLDKKYPVLSINTESHSDLLDLGIEGPTSWELGRTHWAVKDKNLFKFISKYFAKKIEKEPILTSTEMKNIWGENYTDKTCIFFSHKAKYKKEVSNIKKELEKEKFSCFIAHEDIEPSLSWQKEIIKALDTMHIFVGIVTDDFHKGSWTDQEIGYAYKRNTPRMFIKLGESDPQGFVSSEQALTNKVEWSNVHINIIEYIKKHCPDLYIPISKSPFDVL